MTHSSSCRVVVTGLGLVTPVGVGVTQTWAALQSGVSGIGRITRFDPIDFSCQIAGEVKNFEAEKYLSSKEQRKMGRFIHYGIAAVDEALKMAGLLNISKKMQERFGVYLGSGIGGLPEIEEGAKILQERGPRRVSPFFIPAILANLLAGQVSIRHHLKGPNVSPVSACATGAHSIGEAMKIIQRGEADIMLAGGAEASISPLGIAGFANMKALSKGYNNAPEKACRPFDKNRDGFVMGEGAGVLVLESEDHAKARGATILAAVTGFGQSADGYHMTSPDPEGSGVKRAINIALKEANLIPSDIDYINAHATSTPMGDEIESQVLEDVFGANILVSSTKSMTGHMLGAAGGVEAAICVLALRDGVLPPTINVDTPSDNCRLDYISNKARKMSVKAVLNNSFGFGGTNAVLVFVKT